MSNETTDAATGWQPDVATSSDMAADFVPSQTETKQAAAAPIMIEEPATSAASETLPTESAVEAEAPAATPEPESVDDGQTVAEVSNEATQANAPPAESVAQEAPESPPEAELVSVAIEPSDATAATSVAEESQSAAVAEPDLVAELKARLAAEEERAASLAEANEVLRSQLGLASESLDQAKALFDQSCEGMRADVIALVDDLHDRVCEFQERAQAVQAVPAGDRVRVFLTRPAVVAGEVQELGHTLGFVTLADGVTLNYLVDAVRNGYAKGR